MNYQRIYNNIVKKAKSENRTRKNIHRIYYESHHIIPSCLSGTNDRDNRVFLTFREHFLCHWLLCNIYKKTTINYYKLSTAFRRMCSKNKFQQRILNSRHYAIVKRHERNSKVGIAVGGALIKNRSEDWKQNISKSLKGRPNTWMKGKSYNEIYKKEDLDRILKSRKISKNKNTITINNGINMRFVDKSLVIPEGWIRGRIKKNIVRKWFNNGIKERLININAIISSEWKLGRMI